MTTSSSSSRVAVDETLPSARELLAPGPSAALLERFLASRGWTVVEARAAQVVYWPGTSCLVRYRVRGRGPAGGARWLTVCAETRGRGPRQPVVPASGGAPVPVTPPVEQMGDHLVWAFPYDPVLPGLPAATHGRAVRDGLGIEAPGGVSVSGLRYRPTRRAIFRYRTVGETPARTLFGKVMRDAPVRRTFDAYRNLGGTDLRFARPSPHPVPGLVTFPVVPGTSLGERLVAGGRLPSPHRVVGLMASIGAVPWRGDAKPRRYGRSVRSTGRLLAQLLPHRAEEVDDVAAELVARADGIVPTTVVHGDLYESQVLLDDRMSFGLIDLEDAGPGDALLDAANLLAHLGALAAAVPAAAGRPAAYAALLRRVLVGAGVPPEELAWREALCAMLLSPWSFVTQAEAWPRLVEERFGTVVRTLRRS